MASPANNIPDETEFCSCIIPCATNDCNCCLAEIIDFMLVGYIAFNYNDFAEPSFSNSPIAGVA